ncbi:MAG: DUF4476 domain-containing protein [Bacteroidetes bacterium]|nr:DUF4476 domain-containing protein [Bacteroidota bacterium]
MKHITQKIKKIVSFGLLILMIIQFSKTNAENSHRINSTLKLLLPHSGNFTVVFDQKRFFDVNNCFKISNLSKGNHRIKIVEMRFRKGRMVFHKLIFNGVIFIPKSSKVWVKISRSGKIKVDRIIHYNDNKNHHDRREYYYDKNERENYEDDNLNDESFNEYRDNNYYDDEWSSFNSYNDDDFGDEENLYYSDQINGNKKKSFDISLNSIKNQSFDSDRLKIAKNIVKQQNLNSEQIFKITKLFSFESSRLEFAKYAYGFAVDKSNYNIVQSAFQFSSSVSELQDFISKQG